MGLVAGEVDEVDAVLLRVHGVLACTFLAVVDHNLKFMPLSLNTNSIP